MRLPCYPLIQVIDDVIKENGVQDGATGHPTPNSPLGQGSPNFQASGPFNKFVEEGISAGAPFHLTDFGAGRNTNSVHRNDVFCTQIWPVAGLWRLLH